MRVALVHDWLTGMRGGEKVLAAIARLLPDADILTLLHVPGSCDPRLERMAIRTSWLNRLPGVGRYYRYLLPLMPRAIESLDAREYDLIISCSHCVAKGIRRRPDAAHVCYCFTPMRYLWYQTTHYRLDARLPMRLAWGRVAESLKAWDLRSADNVDLFLANSGNVAGRIGQTYGRDAHVVYSPADTDFYTPSHQPRKDYFLMVSSLAPYKRVDQAVEAFGALDLPLRIIGSGQDLRRLRKLAGPKVSLLGWQPDKVVREHYRRCQALIFPGEEDFGLVPLEAMACGTPVIAYGDGGVLETVVDVAGHGPDPATGLLYAPQSVQGLVDAVRRFQHCRHPFDPGALADRARSFGPAAFDERFIRVVGDFLVGRGLANPWANRPAQGTAIA